MFAPRLLPIALAVVLSGVAVAQEAPAPATGATPAATLPMPHDCTKEMARHDHGAGKSTPTPRISGCAMQAPTAAPMKEKAKIGHDHANFHKLM